MAGSFQGDGRSQTPRNGPAVSSSYASSVRKVRRGRRRPVPCQIPLAWLLQRSCRVGLPWLAGTGRGLLFQRAPTGSVSLALCFSEGRGARRNLFCATAVEFQSALNAPTRPRVFPAGPLRPNSNRPLPFPQRRRVFLTAMSFAPLASCRSVRPVPQRNVKGGLPPSCTGSGLSLDRCGKQDAPDFENPHIPGCPVPRSQAHPQGEQKPAGSHLIR